MEIAIILFFLAIFLGAGFLGLLIYMLYRAARRKRRNNPVKTARESDKI